MNDDDEVQVDGSEDTTLALDNNVVLSKPKEDSKVVDKRLKPSVVSSPLKQPEVKVIEDEDVDDIKKSQLLSCVSEIKAPNELSQPRIKRRRLLSSAVHNRHHTAKEPGVKFPFSPVYKRTRSFHKKTLPTSSLTIQQKSSVQSSGKG